MSNANHRVLGRIGARNLTPEEEAIVVGGGGIPTDTFCSCPTPTRPADGDPGECQ